MKENYYLLDAMERYNQNFKRTDWENKSRDETIESFKEIYKELGVNIDVTTWICLYEVDKKYIYAKAQVRQVGFVRDVIAPLFYKEGISYKDWSYNNENKVTVINTHYSKSIELPVYNMKFGELGLEITMRNNFYDWKVSVESKNDLDIDFMNLFNEKQEIKGIYCEGMQSVNKVFGSFKDSKKMFTVEIKDDYNLHTFMYLIANYLKNKNYIKG